MPDLFEILSRYPSWEDVAIRHGLAAWVADEMAVTLRPVPAKLQQAAVAQVAQASKLKRLTHRVVGALAAHEVVPVLLKGYGLASRLFPANPLARPSSDVDLLLAPSQLALTEKTLAELGLTHRAIPGVDDELREHHHRAWVGPGALVEVHFRLFSGFGGAHFDEAGVQARAREGALDGKRVRWLSPDDEFLYLAVHAANHGFLRASWLVDLAQFLECHPELDWHAIKARAEDARCVVPMSVSLDVLEETLEVHLPAAARRAFPVRRRSRGGGRALFSQARVFAANLSEDRLAAFLLRIYLVDSPRQAIRHLLEGTRRAWRQRPRP